VAEHMRADPVLVAGMADTDPHAAEFIADMRLGRAQAVMAGGAAAGLHLYLERGEVELVVEDGDVFRLELEEARRLADRAAALVHPGLRLEQQDAGAADAPLRDQAAEARAPWRKAMALGDRVERHEADIVPLHGVVRAGIAEADPELHRVGH